MTEKLPCWRDEVMPRATLRARTWDTFEIYVGLDPELRNMPAHTGGMLLLGDATGLASTELCDGVPAALFSAEIAAAVAIEAVRTGNTDARSLSRYDERMKNHPIIQWSLSSTGRRDLRYAQEGHDRRMLGRLIHEGWGLGSFKRGSTPLARMGAQVGGGRPAHSDILAEDVPALLLELEQGFVRRRPASFREEAAYSLGGSAGRPPWYH
jgi:hypothetical protein